MCAVVGRECRGVLGCGVAMWLVCRGGVGGLARGGICEDGVVGFEGGS